MKPQVVITQWVHPEVIEALSDACNVIPNTTRSVLPKETLLERSRDAQALMVFMPDSIDEELLSGCPELKVVAGALKGYDNFDVDACTRRNIWFTIVPDMLTIPTAELAIGLLIGITRKIPQGDSLVRSGKFEGWRPVLYGRGITGATCGIIGMGAVGRALAKRLRCFEMKMIYHDPVPLSRAEEAELRVTRVPFEELLAASDFVFPLVPLTDATLNMINASSLSCMKRGAFLINVCRGSVVNEADIADALISGRLAGYAADVFEMEDWARKDRPPAIPQALLDSFENTLFTPHLGSAVDDVRRDIAVQAAENILQVLRGETPMGAVNRLHISWSES